MRLDLTDTMALIVDYQEKLMPAVKDEAEIIKNTEKLVRGLQVLKVPILVSQQYTKGLGMTVPFIRNLFDEPFSYYDKISFSCYQDKDIRDKIEESGRKTIVVSGAETHICVLQTVIDLADAGYRVVFVENCSGSRKEEDSLAASGRMRREGAVIATYESLLFELLERAEGDRFKQIQAIIK